MSQLVERLSEDYKTALARDEFRVTVLRMVIARWDLQTNRPATRRSPTRR